MKLLTHSEMALWRRCKRKWWLSQHRGLQRVGVVDFNRPLGIGNRVHDALAAYYDPELRSDPLQFVRDTVASDLEHYPDHAEAITKESDLATLMIEGYLEWLAETGSDQALRAVESEGAVVVDLVDNDPDFDVKLLSKLDVRVDHEELGGRYAIEHKTVSTIKPPAHLRFNTQFLTEHLAEFLDLRQRGLESEASLGVLWNALLKSKRTARAKGPFYAREPVRHNLEQLRNHWRHVVAIAVEIRDAEDRLRAGEDHHTVVHPNPTDTCSWDCPFVRACPLLDDGSDAERMLANQFEERDPLERYRGLLDPSVESSRS